MSSKIIVDTIEKKTGDDVTLVGNLDVPTSYKITGTDADSIQAPGLITSAGGGVNSSLNTALNSATFPTGHILQVKTGTLTSNFNSTTSGAWLDTGLKVAITPSSTSNKVYVQASAINVGNSASGYNVQVSILHYSSSFVASDDNQIFTTPSDRQFNGQGPNPGNDGVARNYCWGGLHSPSTTSEITYVVAVKGEGSGTSRTIYFNQGHSNIALFTCITAMEVVV